VISSKQNNVNDAVKRLSSPHASGKVGNVRDEESFVEVLKSLAPVDHIVFSGVDQIIRGKLEELDLDSAKHLFGVKFWGALLIGKGWLRIPRLRIQKTKEKTSCREVRLDQFGRITYTHLRWGSLQTRQRRLSRGGTQWGCDIPYQRSRWRPRGEENQSQCCGTGTREE